MKSDRKQSSAGNNLLLALLLLAPALVIIGKSSTLPASEWLRQWFSFAHHPAALTHRLEYVLFVPLGAAVVVFFRLTLGVRLLGPFRSILIAVAFQMTGILLGLLLLVAIIGIIVALRPLLKTLRLPYFARISIMLSTVSLLMILAILASERLGMKLVENVAYFPIVVICLTAEGFARTLIKEGWGSALWRGSMTALVAALIALASATAGLARLLTSYPELLLAQVGVIVLIAQYFDWRLLEKFNPPAKKPTRPSAARAAAETDRAESLDEAEEQTQTL